MGRFKTRREATEWMQAGAGPSSPQQADSDGWPIDRPESPPPRVEERRDLPSWMWPNDGTVPPWRRRADSTEIPESPERRYTDAEMAAILPPGFLDPLPLHLHDPYREPQPEPESEPEEEEPESEPEEAEPEQGHDDAAASGTDSEPDDGLQPYDWDGEEEVESDGTDDLDDAVVVDPPYPIRFTR